MLLGFRYFKALPTQYVLVFRRGTVVREGVGLAFFGYAPREVVVVVPVGSVDAPFAFQETTADYQTVTAQGQVTFRVADPKRVAGLLDFSVNAFGRYASDDPQKLSDRVVTAAQVEAQARVSKMRLRDLLKAQAELASEVRAALAASDLVAQLGVEILGLSILSLRPQPDTANALEAEAREGLLQQADEAMYARRNASVEQERRIKESELSTELAVAEKRQQMTRRRIEADIENEQQRATLVAQRAANDRLVADAQGYALDATLRPLRETDPRVLLAASAGQIDPRTGVALALRELAENAAKIGSVNFTPELLESLTHASEKQQTAKR